MFIKTFFTVFWAVFIAEIGDKTQIATMLFSSDSETSRLAVFLGSAAALVLAAGIGVLIGSQFERFISPDKLRIAAGIGFIAVGIWTLFKG